MEEQHDISSANITKPDQASSVDKDESQIIHSNNRGDRNDTFEDIDNKHDSIPIKPEPHELADPEENHEEEFKSKVDVPTPKTTFMETNHEFVAKNGINHVATDAGDTNETMHTHDVNSITKDAFATTDRNHGLKEIGIGTTEDFDIGGSKFGSPSTETRNFMLTSNDNRDPSDKKPTKWNYDERLREERMRKLQQRQKEISQKVGKLEVHETVEKTAKSVERLKDEIDKLIPIMTDLSPENSKAKKKKKTKHHSEIEKEIYSKEKLKQSVETIEKIKQEQIEHRIKIKKDLELEKAKEQVKQEFMRKTFEEENERKRAFKKTRLEMTLREINEREKERLKKAEEWKKQSEDSKHYHYLYQIKEEDWNQLEETEKSNLKKELEKRSNIFKPHDDNLHKQWSSAMQKKRKEIIQNLRAKRDTNLSPPPILEHVYHGHFHMILSKEEEMLKSMNDEKMKAIKEFNKKRHEFDEMIKKSIKIKMKKFDPEEEKKQPSALDLRVQSVRAKQIQSQKEMYEIGNKNLEDAKQFIRKNKSSVNMSTTGETSRKASNPPDSAKSEMHSPNRINYLPEIKKSLLDKKKKTHLESVMSGDIPDSEKYYLLKAQIEKCDNETKFIENKVKYGKDKNQIEMDKNALDDYNINSLRAKIAILNGLNS